MSNTKLFIKLWVIADNEIKIFDIQGRLVAELDNVKPNTISIQNLKASNQVLIVKVSTDNNQVIMKKVEN